MAAYAPPKIKATALKEFEFPSKLPLTPSFCSFILTEFIKQILYTKGQIPGLFDKFIETASKTKENDTDTKRRLSAKDLKLNRLAQAMNDCGKSISEMMQFHYQNSLSNQSKNDGIVFVDILILFGKSYVSPLETYSLRFYMNGKENNQSQITDKIGKKIRSVIAKNLNKLDKIWDSNLPLTDCRICVNATIGQELADVHFIWKRDLFLRLGSNKRRSHRKKSRNNVYILNFWNKDTAKKVIQQMPNNSNSKNKENNIPFYFVHNINGLISTKNIRKYDTDSDCNESGDSDSENDSLNNPQWFLSNFKFSGSA